MRRLAALPFGPLILVGVLPYLQWQVSAGTHPASDAHRAAALSMVILLALMAAARPLTGSWATAGLAGSLLAAAALAGVGALLPAALILGLILVTAVFDRRIAPARVIIGVNLLSLVMLATLMPVISETLRQPRLVETVGQPIGAARLTRRPSIVHLVLDGYGAPDTFGAVYGHDTAPFRAALAQRGFTVMKDARVPFNQTLPVMASVMSGADVALRDPGISPSSWRRNLGYTVRRGPVAWLLRSSGYTMASAPGGYGFLEFGDAVDVRRDGPRLTGQAKVMPAPPATLPAPPSGGLELLPQPFFYLRHMAEPNPPFVLPLGADARRPIPAGLFDVSQHARGSDAWRDAFIAGYAAQAAKVEQAVIDELDALPPGPRIVIIHGDHGPGAFMDHESAANSCLAERMTTFAAVYSDLPELRDAVAAAADHPFNILNIYRLIFSAISDENYPPLDPPAWFLGWSDPSRASVVKDSALDRNCPAPLVQTRAAKRL